MEFYFLGVSTPSWAGEGSPLPPDIPVCLTRRRLARAAELPRANRPVLLDSSGFGALDRAAPGGTYTDWDIGPRQWARDVRAICESMGSVVAAATMDMMCEPFIVAKTGLTVAEHVRRTVHSSLELTWADPDLPWMHIIQGGTTDDYLRCIDMFDRAGIDLAAAPLVGVGSVCRRQRTADTVALFAALARRLEGTGVRLHGFGVKTLGLARVAPALWSADSHAWSLHARKTVGRCPHPSGVRWEANCPIAAEQWYRAVLAAPTATTEQWTHTVAAHAEHGDQRALFDAPAPPAPNMPGFAQALARYVRVLLPEGAEAPLSAQLAAFIDHLPTPGLGP
jgi:hypothetical protein